MELASEQHSRERVEGLGCPGRDGGGGGGGRGQGCCLVSVGGELEGQLGQEGYFCHLRLQNSAEGEGGQKGMEGGGRVQDLGEDGGEGRKEGGRGGGEPAVRT